MGHLWITDNSVYFRTVRGEVTLEPNLASCDEDPFDNCNCIPNLAKPDGHIVPLRCQNRAILLRIALKYGLAIFLQVLTQLRLL